MDLKKGDELESWESVEDGYSDYVLLTSFGRLENEEQLCAGKLF